MSHAVQLSRAQAGAGDESLQVRYAQLQARFAAQSDELQQSRQQLRQYQAMLNHLPVLIAYWDQHLINRYANQAYESWLGQRPDQIQGQHMETVLGKELFAKNRFYIERVLAGQKQRFEREVVNPQTQERRSSQADYIPYFENGTCCGFFVLVTDITALREAELALLKRKKLLFDSERRYRSVVTDQTELISRLRGDGCYLFANEVFCKFFNIPPDQLIGARWAPLVHPEDLERVNAELSLLSAEHPVVMIENRVISGTGQSHWMQFSNRGFFNTDGKLREIQSVGRDITQRKLAETELLQLNQALTASRRALREMAAHNESLIETERKRISREVHDELGQLLTALRMDILYLQMRYCTLDPGLEQKIDGMKQLVDQAMQGVRNVAAHLRPAALDIGLIDALRWLCSEFSNKSGVPCQLHANLNVLRPDEQKSIVLFRIVQESLTNITRYARATQVNVHMEYLEQALIVSVIDNGIGFDLQQPSVRKSFGLLGMQERALALGGTVSIRSRPACGTCVAVSIPMDATEIKAET